ncbi:hypothetical protein AB1Y20_022096 [Prymnesium parvum]|uniref:DNA-directed RNA polymerases I, II, and III subunit RPABC1 n=1 Tax=Prymnesium parvum TaxID=97485 RepID=A0AB34JG86_PRYPA|eukprot:CAMPEP_0182844550 /NCGR_PEP_ID=MMETSP0006_2-20121128/26825_1 /TAXON_ID=97485 /ORGANISM="Prymnesium parvum, Strain Texoma1" /LENGTH=204 /DNA_ID=CAMNT_0024974505 /DNA_START=116 /DNA_END=730 /DNA_ORIENTATION=+
MAERVYRVRRTVHQMLRDRGYMVDQADIDEKEEVFAEKFAGHSNRDWLTILVQKRDNPTDQIFVFWPSDPRVGVKPIQGYHEKMKQDEVKRGIIIVQQVMTNFAREKALSEINNMAGGWCMEWFLEAELLVNITEHVLVPHHQLLSKEEKMILLKKYRMKEAQLPRMQLQDPVSRYYGLSRGQVVRIIRPSETAGKYVTYRLVV